MFSMLDSQPLWPVALYSFLCSLVLRVLPGIRKCVVTTDSHILTADLCHSAETSPGMFAPVGVCISH